MNIYYFWVTPYLPNKPNKDAFSTSWTNRWTNQRNSQGEEPGVDEKVVSTNLDDVEEQWGDGQQDTLRHNKLLHSILKEEPQRLRGREDVNFLKKTMMDNRKDVCSGLGPKLVIF